MLRDIEMVERAMVDESLSRVETGPHLGHLEARALESSDWLAEGLTQLHIVEGDIEGALGVGQELHRPDQPLLGEIAYEQGSSQRMFQIVR